MASQFSWIPFYRELTQRVLQYDTRQPELVAVMEAMRAAGLPGMFLQENVPEGGRQLLQVIDPFTFMMNLNITTAANQRRLCAWLHDHWNMSAEVPDDFVGLPTFQPIAPWFFWDATKRQPEDLPRLWQLARSAWDADAAQVAPDLYKQCRQIKGVGLAKLSTGLYWLAPNGFLPLAGKMLPYLISRGIAFNKSALEGGDLEEYRNLIAKAHEVSYNHPELAQQAWLWQSAAPVGVSDGDRGIHALNTILYGPPGTGKTFSTIARAVEIIEGYVPEARADCVALFEQHRSDGRIRFVTFHQSFSYEEFVEGLRPVVESEGESARYEITDGIFKEMAARALSAVYETRTSGDSPKHLTFDELWEQFITKFSTSGTLLDGRTRDSQFDLRFAGDMLVGVNVAGPTKPTYRVSVARLREVYGKLPHQQKLTHHNILAACSSELGPIPEFQTSLIGAVLQELRQMDHDSYSAQLSGEASLPGTVETDNGRLARQIRDAPRYVLIIDEINRGNISKIFGELITLLEDDKRLGGENPLTVTLPYSSEPFIVPPNLYVLGTMNTADKSLALLDVALRRRFTFEELCPDFAKCEFPASTPFKLVLDHLNTRIMHVLDREHRIGHAYFMRVSERDDFNAVFRNKIVPLLQEYFYNDWDALRSVLGETGDGAIVCTLKPIDGVRSRTRFAWWYDVGAEEPDFISVLWNNFVLEASAAAP